MEKKELKERFFDRFFYAEDGSCDWDRWRNQDPNVVLEFVLEELSKAREEVCIEILNFVEEESGKSGRKEILEYIKGKSKELLK